MRPLSARMPVIDTLKALASQVIVLHHVVSYGPVAKSLALLIPLAATWLFDYGRMAVQVFLVVSGFLAARSLPPDRLSSVSQLASTLWRRYRRLVTPFAVAIVCAIVAAALARMLWQDDAVPASPSVSQVAAHLLLLHGLLNVDALSAGVWYVAIDFQLFALMALLLLFGSGGACRTFFLVALLVAISLLGFNREPEWDAWGVYFFGSYGLGALAYWLSAPGLPSRQRWPMLVTVGVIVVVALVIDFRLRIALAASVALLLGVANRPGYLRVWPGFRPLAWLGEISYSLFLIHFPVLLLVNAACNRMGALDATQTLVAVLLIWLGSLGAGALLYRYVETR